MSRNRCSLPGDAANMRPTPTGSPSMELSLSEPWFMDLHPGFDPLRRLWSRHERGSNEGTEVIYVYRF